MLSVCHGTRLYGAFFKAPPAGVRLKWQYVVTRLLAQPFHDIPSPVAFG
jgi:hypothetical protein